MTFIAYVVRAINGLNWLIGNVFAWLALAIVAVCFTVVVQRYLFATTHLWMQDLYVWLNGAMFTAVAGFTLMRNDHVRVDIFYRPATVRTKAMIDLFGVLIFVLPFCWIVYSYGLVSVTRSWRFLEPSPNPGGMPGYFVLKTFVLVFAAVLALQALSMALRSILVLFGREELLPPAMRYEADGSAH